MADGADPLSHNDLGSGSQLPVQALSKSGIRAIVQGGEGVIKNKYFRFPGQSPGDRQALFLPTGYVASQLSNGMLTALGQLVYEFTGLRQVNGLF